MGMSFALGLLYVAKALQKINIEVKIFHYGIQNLNELQYDNYLFVGITMLTGDFITNGLNIANKIKNYNTNIPIVLGGVHPSLLPEESLKNKLVDVVVIGEGEETVKELADAMIHKKSFENIKGIGYKNNENKIFINPPRDFIDMEKLDIDLPFELLGRHIFKSLAMPVHTSRGCPYRCGFCYNPVMNKRKYRQKSAARVVEEIEFLKKKYKVSNFYFDFDDEFFIDYRRAFEIFKIVIDKKIEIRWSSFCRFDTFVKAYNEIGQEFVDVLKKSGCYYLSLGAESGSQRMLDEIIKKDIKIEQIEKTVDILKKNKITHRVSFICCFPDEHEEDFQATLSVIDRISADNNHIVLGWFILIPLPGTSIFELLVTKHNFKAPQTLEEWGNYKMPDNSYKRITWLPHNYAKKCSAYAAIANYPFHKEFNSYNQYKEYVHSTSSAYSPNLFGYIASKIVRYRYKNKKFHFLFEVELCNKLTNLQFFIGKYILKKLLPNKFYQAIKIFFGYKAWIFKK
ncbi:B12-binding domain-containing radical SAM protein [Candidatus Dependentiae bacterium]|nr:B12-binding domain-containing radical SAM protein [Candidatus Dependentiae bacterium]